MAGLDHGASFPKEQEDMVLAARNARYGMVLFIIYLLIYGGFVVISAFWPGLPRSESSNTFTPSMVPYKTTALSSACANRSPAAGCSTVQGPICSPRCKRRSKPGLVSKPRMASR